jgi:asparagine synthase (glutamine-hydrolysing)
MQAYSGRSVPTYTIGFDDPRFDESAAAGAIARHLGTDHHEIRLSSRDAVDLVPRIATIYDQPFADASQIPTHLICQAARADVTVALSGDAGDELFGGYSHYFTTPRNWQRLRRFPKLARQMVGTSIGALPEKFLEQGDQWLTRASRRKRADKLGGGLAKVAAALETSDSLATLQLHFASAWERPNRIVPSTANDIWETPEISLPDEVSADSLGHDQAELMLRDFQTYLPDDILTKVDRAAMAVGLETRVPFLDRDVIELSWRLPVGVKIRGTQSKWALRQILYKHVPRELVDRPKAGFSVPLGDWLRGPLRDWAESLMNLANLPDEGLVDLRPARLLWDRHLRTEEDHSAQLWPVLAFQAWNLAGPPQDLTSHQIQPERSDALL